LVAVATDRRFWLIEHDRLVMTLMANADFMTQPGSNILTGAHAGCVVEIV